MKIKSISIFETHYFDCSMKNLKNILLWNRECIDFILVNKPDNWKTRGGIVVVSNEDDGVHVRLLSSTKIFRINKNNRKYMN